MAIGKDIPSFDEMIQADRLRRKNEALANEILGKGRKASNPLGVGKRKAGAGASLASRLGVTKPSSRPVAVRSAISTPNLKAGTEANWGHDLHHANNLKASRVSRLPRDHSDSRTARINRLHDAAVAAQERNGADAQANPRAPGNGMSIRGLAGPYVVIGSNFAPGTTSADIESAMVPLGGDMQSCRIITSSPTVIAEMVFLDKAGAENVVATFNNQKADGRLLHVYMKTGPPTPAVIPAVAPVRAAPTEPRASRPDLTRPNDSYNAQREQSDRNRRRADPEIQDGRYGFEAKDDEMDVEMSDGRDVRRDDRRDVWRNRDNGVGQGSRRLYSDDLYPRARGRGRGRGFN